LKSIQITQQSKNY